MKAINNHEEEGQTGKIDGEEKFMIIDTTGKKQPLSALDPGED
jgi:hypothetical protein